MNNHASIIMLSYRAGLNKRKDIFRQSLSSLFENTDYPFELILVDNTFNNRGMGGGRNYGARQATGKYLVFTDDDILFLPNWLSNCIALLKYGENLISTPLFQDRVGRWEREKIGPYRVNDRVGSNCMIMRRETFDDIGEFDVILGNYGIAKTGKVYCNRQVAKGYTVIMPRKKLAIDLGFGKHSYA